ncbi:MAG: DoxX family protein [Bacteroidia bacterium]|nr:DoxX family protein [Bacteroidia bacterium]
MKMQIFKTSDQLSPALLRITLGLVVLAHGVQKLFGWFDGYGFSSTMSYFTDSVGLPWALGFFIVMLETAGALALIAGLATRLVALSYIGLAIGIVMKVHLGNWFFMNWFNNHAGEGYEFFILWVGIAVALVILGGGRYSLDKLIAGGG